MSQANWNVENKAAFTVVNVGAVKSYGDASGWNHTQKIVLEKDDGRTVEFVITKDGLGGDHFEKLKAGCELRIVDGAHFASKFFSSENYDTESPDGDYVCHIACGKAPFGTGGLVVAS